MPDIRLLQKVLDVIDSTVTELQTLKAQVMGAIEEEVAAEEGGPPPYDAATATGMYDP